MIRRNKRPLFKYVKVGARSGIRVPAHRIVRSKGFQRNMFLTRKISKKLNLRGNTKTTYHLETSCNKCSGRNEVTVLDSQEGHLHEAKTKCIDCGHEDYWYYGFFESSQHMESNCKMYEV